MVDFPDLSILSNNPSMGELLSLPNASYPFYWAWILGGIWLIITMSLYFKEKLQIGKGNLLSSMAVSSFANLILSVVGTMIGFIVLELMVSFTVINILIIVIWLWSTTRS